MIINSLDELAKIALDLAKKAQPNCYFLLSGDLGAGKTTFTKMLLANLGVAKVVASPTFVILNQYEGDGLKINHMDAYRLTQSDDISEFLEQFEGMFNVIEWWENLNFDFKNVLSYQISFKIIDENTREIKIKESKNA